MEIDRGAPDGDAVCLEGGAVGAGNGRSADETARVSSSGEDGSRSYEVKEEDIGCDQFYDKESRSSDGGDGNSVLDDEGQKDEFGAKDDVDNKDDVLESEGVVANQEILKTEREAEPSKSSGTVYKSLMSEFDEYVANEKFGLVESGVSRALKYGFEVGDMVWGKVKSHPFWPGHIFNEAFATSSVRRTSRAGHVLVAFFGDSSYGWFDPAELIPFDTNFAEKAQQTTSRTFVKAVEEAMDEIGRRRGLGLACKCRNKYNFRPTNVQGYFTVDVPDYELGGAYSKTQIKKARDSFVPRETLDFIQQLASEPHDNDETALDFVKNKATVFAYRKAVFEEFDETYAQAFGMPAARPSHDTAGAADQPVKGQARAPLSGPLVIAETLGGSRISSKPLKVKDQSKKDKYLFKRRDDSAPGSASPSSPAAYMEGPSAAGAGGYVLQKRVPSQSPGKQEQDRSTGNTTLGQDMKTATPDGTPLYGSSSTDEGVTEDAKSVYMQESRENIGMKPAIPGLDQVQGSGSLANASLVGVSRAKVGADGVVKKKKALKRPPGEMGSEMMTPKKKKKKIGPEQRSDHLQNRPATGKSVRPPNSREGTYIDPLKKYDGSSSVSDYSGSLSAAETGNSGLELTHLLDGLQYLAVDHFHGTERTDPAIVKQSFLRFRSLVYQKSLVLVPASDSDSVEIRPAKSSSVRTPKQSSSGVERKSPHPKMAKPSMRPDDPSKVGRKRAPSDRQEELEAKKLKTMSKLKALVKKGQDTRPGEGKETAAAAPLPKSAKPGLARRGELPAPPPPRAAEPTMLVIKFPPKTSLPSVPELKARFARFGPLDYSGIRVFWKSSTCRVVFQHKPDAQAACKYAMGNNSLFGTVSVRCHVRPVEVPGSEGLETAPKAQEGDESTSAAPRSKDLNPERQAGAPLPYQPMPPQQSVQLKSCLKKPPGEDAGTAGGNGGKGTARVKFLLGGEENTARQDAPPAIGNSSNNIISGSYGDGAASSSTSTVGGTIYNSKNIQQQKSSLPALLPLPPQFASDTRQPNNPHRPPENPLRTQLPPPPPPKTSSVPFPTPTTMASVDISQQMISLLTRCNDVVSSLTGFLGYVPYHPL